MSGAKKASARASAAMRGPSRQITTSDDRRRIAPRRDRARQIGEHQAFGAVGDAGQRQRLAGRQQFGGRFRHRATRASRCAMEVAQAAEQRRVVIRAAVRIRR